MFDNKACHEIKIRSVRAVREYFDLVEQRRYRALNQIIKPLLEEVFEI